MTCQESPSQSKFLNIILINVCRLLMDTATSFHPSSPHPPHSFSFSLDFSKNPCMVVDTALELLVTLLWGEFHGLISWWSLSFWTCPSVLWTFVSLLGWASLSQTLTFLLQLLMAETQKMPLLFHLMQNVSDSSTVSYLGASETALFEKDNVISMLSIVSKTLVLQGFVSVLESLDLCKWALFLI